MATIYDKMTAIADAVRAKTGGTSKLSLDDMAAQISNISTGAELNFEVVGGTTQPASAIENTIWVNTDTPITGYCFSATQPTNMVNGDVWIGIATLSVVSFNALKKDGIMIYPLHVKQMVSGSLKDKTAKSYQGGEWLDWWNGVLYDSGNQYTNVTGGWESNEKMLISGWNQQVVEFASGSINIGAPQDEYGDYGYSAVVNTVKKIDVTAYNTLYFDVQAVNHAYSDSYGIIPAYGETYDGGATAMIGTTNAGRQTLSIDISSISGEYYVFASVGGRYRKIYKIWLK